MTHDGRREIIWRIHDPQKANAVLRGLLGTKDYSREFEYRIDEDPAWDTASWYLDNPSLARNPR